jgi:hypothetical protein
VPSIFLADASLTGGQRRWDGPPTVERALPTGTRLDLDAGVGLLRDDAEGFLVVIFRFTP